MKLAVSLLFIAATTASALVLSPAIQLESNLPSKRFRVEFFYDAPFLPVNPTLANINFFMNIIARGDIGDRIQPQTYSSALFPQVEVKSHTLTESRYLLWGVFLAATNMVKFTRFNNVLVKMYWDKTAVGQMSILAKSNLNLPATSQSTDSTAVDEGPLGRVDISNMTSQVSIEGPNAQNITGSGTADNNSGSRTFKIDFDSVPGAVTLKRNDVFLSFFAATLHVAKYPVINHMKYFNCKAPDVNLRVHMYEMDSGCLYGHALAALAFVPMYMMEHPEFGYRETSFNVMVGGIRGCRGSILDDLLGAS